MSHVEGVIIIMAPPARVQETLEDIAHAPEWVTSLQKVWDIQGRGKGCTYKWTFKMGGVNVDGATEITDSTLERFVMSTSGGIPSQWTWEMQPAEGGTEVRLSIDYNVPGSIFGAIANKLIIEKENEKELRSALVNLKGRLEGWNVD
jgi:uncharacterized membrane protein